MALSFTHSRALQKRAESLIPGGVDSPVRAFRSVGGDPPFVASAQGAYLYDADGNRFLDYFGSWGPMILGHAHPAVIDAVQKAAANGTSFGASTAAEAELASLVVQAVPSIEMLRFVSSGTEAVMSAIRLARAFTGRKFILKFEGCYHGHSDALLVKAGSGVATLGIPGSAGVPEETVQFTLALPFNDVSAVEEAFRLHQGKIACIIVEPVVGNAGTILPAPGYLEALRAITEREGALLIFDEVMTGFRLSLGGAQEIFHIKPDLTTLGKIIGGGLPVGAFGGRQEIMQMLAPLGPVYQAGTLSGNPLAMAAGIATVSHLIAERATIYPQLAETTRQIAVGVAKEAKAAGVPMSVNWMGSMVTWFFTETNVTDFDTASTSDMARFGKFHRAMLERGIWLPPSQYEAAFVSASHGEAEVDFTISAAREVFANLL
ncbi:glutamate-1-semialdehyde 2,1-aminomutase [Terriglobus saanensis]|uniref:Glutamate-1-semialdehyde 2,1-aminomutase n=1 Tax=Terriglobus saanensis (strain ATCC BAA-1853 / DSM 23119 / SP1PR4) TaxID=401053 RepID=E8V366_TERSS|nr:glutamate-1-semialdehyde 2,1-aminomutase [Terriglobus saanensis]ADV81341.1 glutamate-1-semialdehyde-2,1-aminomutase [Terriglobus saanensis SP1PR4]